MKTNDVSARNIGCMITLMVTCSQLMIGFNPIKQDIWASIIAGFLAIIPMIAIYIRVAKLNLQKDLFEIIAIHFGSRATWIITLAVAWFAFHISTLVVRNFSELVTTISLESTPRLLVCIGIIFVSAYLARSDFKIIGRWSLSALIVVAAILVFTIIFSLPIIDFRNLKPILQEHSFKEIVSSGFSIGAIAFGETFLAMIAFGSMKPKEAPLKAYGLGIFMGVIIMLAATLRNILVLGKQMLKYTIFPSYVATRIISAGDFVERLESVITFTLILMGITKAAICLKAAAMGTKRLLKTEVSVKHIVVPIAMLSASISVITFDNMQQMIDFMPLYRSYTLPFVLVIPLIIWIKSERQNRRIKPGRGTQS